jgi:hypothetical protein
MTVAQRAGNILPAPEFERLHADFLKVWTADTSAEEEWRPEVPEAGHCAVTALLLQDLFGGELRRALANGVSHYWNRLPDGRTVDLTRVQFLLPLTLEEEKERARSYVLSFAPTRERYELLKTRMRKLPLYHIDL